MDESFLLPSKNAGNEQEKPQRDEVSGLLVINLFVYKR